MQKEVSTNIHLPVDVWKAVKVKAAQEGKSMKQLVLEGLSYVLKRKEKKEAGKDSLRELLLKYAGTMTTGLTDGSVNHDKYIYDKP